MERFPQGQVGPPQESTARIRFGSFEVDGQVGEMYKGGLRVHVQEKPLQALLLLTGRPGRLVTRQELIEALWPDDRYGDFEHGLNLVINRLRTAIHDRADCPRFIQTMPRRGYRFIAPVAGIEPPPPGNPWARPETAGSSPQPAASGPAWRDLGLKGLVGALLGLALVSFSYWLFGLSVTRLPAAPTSNPGREVLLVLPFRDLSPEPAEYLSQGLTVELIAHVGRLDPEQLGVIAGERQRASEVLRSFLESSEMSGRYVPPYRVALVYSALEEEDEAFRWLEAALEERAFEMSLLKVDPRLDPLRDDSRFQALVGKVYPERK